MDQFWCKHFHLVYLFITILLHGSFASYSSSASNGDEPTEEPEEYISSRVMSNSSAANVLSNATLTFPQNGSAQQTTEDTPEASKKINESYASERHEQDQARAFPHSSGNAWKTASKFLQKGVRLFRESLLEGAKVAHMFKEDVDEGMQNIMRQNRGIKKSDANVDQSKSGSGSFYDSQMLREGVLGGILRFMGVNSKQMGVIALNVLIILAEWITSSMIGNNEVAGATSRMIKTNLLQWASTGRNSQIEKLLLQAKSHTLPEKLIDKLGERTGNSTSCVQLLLCKMSPMIWGFQDTVDDQMKAHGIQDNTPWRTATRTDSTNNGTSNEDNYNDGSEPRGFLATSQFILDKFLTRLPPTEKIVDFGDRCETKFPHCKLLKFGMVETQ